MIYLLSAFVIIVGAIWKFSHHKKDPWIESGRWRAQQKGKRKRDSYFE